MTCTGNQQRFQLSCDRVTAGQVVSVVLCDCQMANRGLFGTTPNGFYREMRLAKANNLLLNTTISVREIGLACGFPNGFSSIYKSFFGVTPVAQRRARRQSAQR